jgi:hypothetical protein
MDLTLAIQLEWTRGMDARPLTGSLAPKRRCILDTAQTVACLVFTFAITRRVPEKSTPIQYAFSKPHPSDHSSGTVVDLLKLGSMRNGFRRDMYTISTLRPPGTRTSKTLTPQLHNISALAYRASELYIVLL